MANNKVVFGNTTIMDITDTTAEAADVAAGEVFYDRSGVRTVGTGNYMDKVSNPTADNILVVDVNGQAQDSGVSIDSVAVDQTYDAASTNAQSGTAVAGAIANKADVSAIPTAVSDLTNDSGFQTAAQVETKILEELENFEHVDYEIVQTLPAAGQEGIRYLLEVTQSGTTYYEEYLYIYSQWRDIGQVTSIHLTDYYTKLETDDLLDLKQDTLTFDTTPTSGSNNPVTSGGIKSVTDNLQTQIDALGEPFRLQDFQQSFSSGITIPSCTVDIANTSIANVDIDLNVIDPTGTLNQNFAIASLAKYEVYDATSGGNRINCWPVCSFSMNSQRTLRLRMMCGGPNSKVARRIAGAILLKHR